LFLLQAFVVVGDNNGHVGLGVKCAKEVSLMLLPHAAILASLLKILEQHQHKQVVQ